MQFFFRSRANPDGCVVTIHCGDAGAVQGMEVRHFDGTNNDFQRESMESSGINLSSIDFSKLSI